MKNQAEVVNQAKNNNQAAIKSLEIRSKTEEEATKKAIEQLNVNKDDIENIKVEVIEEPNKGFLGFIGAKDGLYKITVTEKVEIIEDNKNPFDGNSENNNECNEEKSNLEKTVTVESDPKLDEDKTVEHISEENE